MIVWLLCAGAAIGLVRWLAANWWILVAVAAAATMAGVAALHVVQQRRRAEALRLSALRIAMTGPGGIDSLSSGTAFEHRISELMRRDGFKAKCTGGRGDQGCDVLGIDPQGRRWVVQCKFKFPTSKNQAVGAPVLHGLNGTARSVHQADITVAVTNGRFTADATAFGREQRIELVDRRLLADWAAGAQPLWKLLRRLPPARGGPSG